MKQIPEYVRSAVELDRQKSDREMDEKAVALARSHGRGGARPGAGRPVGKWDKARGRKKTALINCYVPDEVSEKLSALAQDTGLTKTDIVCLLIRNANSANLADIKE